MAKSERNLRILYWNNYLKKVNAKLRSRFSAIIYWFSLLLFFLFNIILLAGGGGGGGGGGAGRLRTVANTPVDIHSLRKQPTFCDADLGSASDWLKQISHAAPPIKSTTQVWVVIHLQYSISALFPHTSFWGGNSWRHKMSAVCLG